MRGHEITAGWTSPKQLYDGYRNLSRVQCEGNFRSPNQSKVTSIGQVKILSQRQETPVKRVLFDPTKKETDQKLSDQTKKISFLKSDLSHLKLKVLQLSSTDINPPMMKTAPKWQWSNDGFLTPRHTESQNSTTMENSIDAFDFNDECSSNPRSESKISAEKIVTEHRLWEKARASERKPQEDRDDLSCRALDISRDSNPLRQSFQSTPDSQHFDRMRDFSQPRDTVDRSLQLVIDGLRRQNGDLQAYYKQKMQEANNERKQLQGSLRIREQELVKARAEILALQKNIANHENLSKLVLNLQETNRKLEKDKAELTDRLRVEQYNMVSSEQRLRKSEDQNKVIKDLKDRLLQENMRLKNDSRLSAQQISRLRDTLEKTVHQKNREINLLNYDKQKLTKAVKYYTESQQTIRSSSLQPKNSGNVSPASPKRLFVSSPKNEDLQLEQIKEELKQLCLKIEQLQNQKKALESQVKNRVIKLEESRPSPQAHGPTIQELQGQLMLRQQTICKMHDDIKGLEYLAERNRELEERMCTNETMLRQANQQVMRSHLALLNHKYR